MLNFGPDLNSYMLDTHAGFLMVISLKLPLCIYRCCVVPMHRSSVMVGKYMVSTWSCNDDKVFK